MKARFIAIEGIDGSGKTTLITKLATKLYENKNAHILITREPYDRNWLDQQTLNNGKKALKLFITDRKKHIKIIQNCQKQGITTITDRYKHSAYAYQTAQGIPFEEIHELQKTMPAPDITLIIDVPVDIALTRIEKERQKTPYEKKEMLTKARQNYLKLKEKLNENIKIIDGTKSPEEVLQQALTFISQYNE